MLYHSTLASTFPSFSSSSSSSSSTSSLLFPLSDSALLPTEINNNNMVKFSKQFEGQLIPEWKHAFVDYCQLKNDLKKLYLLKTDNKPDSTAATGTVASTVLSSIKNFSIFGHQRRDHGPIHVHKKLASSVSKGDMYETELLEQFADTAAAKEFFSCLDFQLNKVNQFFKTKETEFMELGESLKKQLEILIDLKTAIQHRRQTRDIMPDSKEDGSISYTISCESDKDKTEQEQSQENINEELEKTELAFSDSPRSEETGNSTKTKSLDLKWRSVSGQVISFQGKNIKMNIPLTTPSRTFSAISHLFKEDLTNSKKSNEGTKLHINKTRVHHAEKMIKGAFVELYKGLGFLKTYRQLNKLAFIKILKKFDKVSNNVALIIHSFIIASENPVCNHEDPAFLQVTGKQVLAIYLKVVESSYFNSSDKVIKLADEVEELFTKNFAEEDKRKAMKYLRPKQRKESHGITFIVGLFSGCFIALLVGYVIMAHIMGTYKRHPFSLYMETVYPVLSMFSLMFLHFFLYGCNIFAWRKTRINYSFILELSATKELKYRDVFLICTTSMTAVMGVMFVHLALLSKGYSYTQVQVIPGLLLLLFLLLLVCPFNIYYRSSRYRFLRVMRNIAFSPLYKVLMLDFFMADQLCSQIPMLRNLEYMACYYITGSYKTQNYNYCMNAKHYRDLAYAVSFLPYYWRAMQCARRWFDEGQTSHLVNLGKYVSAMLAAGSKVAYEKDKTKGVGWLCLVVIMSSGATVYQLYWDFVKDWGLLQVNSKNPWLRNDLMLRRKTIYYVSMGLNFILRLAWLQTVLHSTFGHVDSRVTGLFLAALEVIRRGLWNFFRLENEHLNNAGKFRAVNPVPLPFDEVDEVD
ncbi:phosphate transporter PHO1 homolog 1-like isoform X1 [Cucurbita pepo subsp. pepo]|uniref:phosphate transporter PHO1 homolog 1-like isoform X1 n=1 Tax=Cucurbita pepo subsp. pepo TaxID=3664 RepID=UPI000C9D443A|nr:phosphate transporter PHO1 homolog 1-like isoform X1 [Cucurbita pepo subsp. pepo]